MAKLSGTALVLNETYAPHELGEQDSYGRIEPRTQGCARFMSARPSQGSLLVRAATRSDVNAVGFLPLPISCGSFE